MRQTEMAGSKREGPGKRLASALMAIAAIGLQPLTAASLGAAESPEQTAPQGRDAPDAEVPDESVPGVNSNQTLSEQLDRNKGVITPPPTGDEGIHVQVPNPEAGSEEEVIPPPDAPGGNPDVEPR